MYQKLKVDISKAMIHMLCLQSTNFTLTQKLLNNKSPVLPLQSYLIGYYYEGC